MAGTTKGKKGAKPKAQASLGDEVGDKRLLFAGFACDPEARKMIDELIFVHASPDPTNGSTHHAGGAEAAATSVDHDYDGMSFCVSQALFPGGGSNAWEKLQKALKGSIDEEKLDQLRTTRSLPFKPGNKVAVKVIDDRGNEVIKGARRAQGAEEVSG